MATDRTTSDSTSILLVDDEEMVRSLLSRALRADRHLVVAVGTKREAFEQLSQARFQLLIVDKNLPDGSGLSLIEGARNMGLDAEAIVITGYSDTDSAIQAVALRVFRYIRKPFDLDALRVDINRAIETNRLRRVLSQRTEQLEKANAGLEEALSRAHDAESRRIQSETLATIGSLAAGVAHEINNPLSMLSMAIPFAVHELDTMLRTDAVRETPEQALAALATIEKTLRQSQEAVEFLIGLSSDLHSLGKPMSAELRPVKVADIVGSALRLVRHQLKHKALVVVDVPEELHVRGQQKRLVQVLINLLTNAGRAIPDSAPDRNEISVCARRDGNAAVIDVSDTGIGIAPEEIERIFDRFYTTGDGTSREGSGLGLAIVREILNEHNGTVEVHSERGRGTRFSIRLPATSETGSLPPISAVARPSAVPGEMVRARRKILFVDSAQENLASYERSFGQMHSVLLAQGLGEATKLLREDGPDIDVVVCELSRDATPLETCGELVKGHAELASRLVFVGESGEVTDQARALGMTVLIKPVRPAVLLAEIYRIPPKHPHKD